MTKPSCPSFSRSQRKRLLLPTLVALVALLSSGTAQAVDVHELHAAIVHGNGAVAGKTITSKHEGDWRFRVEITGQVTDLFVQLWYPQKRNSCADNAVGNSHYEAPKRSYLATDTIYEDSFHSPYTGAHCARIIIWGKPGATAKATVIPPAMPRADGVLQRPPL